MPNKNYLRGVNKERRICQKLKEKEGFEIAQRSAGSHSPIDIFAIHREKKIIYFIQAKPKKFSEAKKSKIEEELNFLQGEWNVRFAVV